VSKDKGASPSGTGLAGAEAPEPHSGLGPSGGIPSAADLRKLLELHEAASSGQWRVDRSGYGESLWITTWSREWSFGDDDSDGPICHVSTERTITKRSRFRDGVSYTKKKIGKAAADAELIVAAVNALPKLVAALMGPGQVDETAWLIEYPADKYGPVRYLAIGEPPVIDAADATRFARKLDAEKYMRAHDIKRAAATEHAWTGIDPAQAMSARTGQDPKGLEGEAPPARSAQPMRPDSQSTTPEKL
jgi:hypothetical protein